MDSLLVGTQKWEVFSHRICEVGILNEGHYRELGKPFKLVIVMPLTQIKLISKIKLWMKVYYWIHV